MEFNKKEEIEIDGLGFIIYSEGAISHINEGENYLESHFMDGEEVVDSINKGEIIGISTGSSGECVFEWIEGEPKPEFYESHDFAFQVPINVTGGKIIIRDLYDLADWTKEPPVNQVLEIEDGLYSIIVVGSLQSVDYCLRTRDIYLFIVRDEDAFLAQWDTIPSLFNE